MRAPARRLRTAQPTRRPSHPTCSTASARRSEGFIAGVGRQLATDHDVAAPEALRATLIADTSVIGTGDVLGILRLPARLSPCRDQPCSPRRRCLPSPTRCRRSHDPPWDLAARAWLGCHVDHSRKQHNRVRRPSADRRPDRRCCAQHRYGGRPHRYPPGRRRPYTGGDRGTRVDSPPELASAIATQVPSVVSLNCALVRRGIDSDRLRNFTLAVATPFSRFADRVAVDPAPARGDPRCDALHRRRRADRSAPSAAAARRSGGGARHR